MRALLLLLLLFSSGCVRLNKALVAPRYAMDESPEGEVVDVRYTSGWAGEPEQDWAPAKEEIGGKSRVLPTDITSEGTLAIAPRVEDAEISLWIRRAGWGHSGFTRVIAVTGAIDKAIPNEIRLLPRDLTDELVLPMHQLHNVYNDYTFTDGDLLLVRAEAPGHEPESYLFRSQEFGLRTKFGANVLIRTPIPWVESEGEVSPALALTASFGYRARSRNPTLRWFGRQVALVTAVGIGSTDVRVPTGIDDELQGYFNAALAGGGIEFYDFLSVQVLVNISSLGRDRFESNATLAIGFDAVQFGRFTADLGTRLFKKNEL